MIDIIVKKRTITGIAVGGLLLLSVLGNGAGDNSTELKSIEPGSTKSSATQDRGVDTIESVDTIEKISPTCDGVNVTASCTKDGISYKTYIYHPAVAEKTRTETTISYKQEISGYCTLCNDGTYSPSCATGRGACSRHDGVAEWNAPRYRQVPVENKKIIVEAPAKEAFYEKVEG